MNSNTFKTAMAIVGLSALLLGGCDSDGPAEQAGEKIDQAAEQAREGLNDAGDAVSQGVERAGDKIEAATD